MRRTLVEKGRELEFERSREEFGTERQTRLYLLTVPGT